MKLVTKRTRPVTERRFTVHCCASNNEVLHLFNDSDSESDDPRPNAETIERLYNWYRVHFHYYAPRSRRLQLSTRNIKHRVSLIKRCAPCKRLSFCSTRLIRVARSRTRIAEGFSALTRSIINYKTGRLSSQRLPAPRTECSREHREMRRVRARRKVRGHVSGCKYNRGVSRGKVKWLWRAGARRIGRN